MPAQAHVIAAADGPALASPAFRRVLDAVRSHTPATLGCVLDAATTGEAVAVGVHPDAGTTIVIITRAVVANCPALSKIGAGVWAATVGAGVLAPDRAQSMLAGARWARARPYLLREPFAMAVELPALRVVAVAQPEPIDAWLTVDASDSAAAERTIKVVVDGWRAPPTIELAGKLSVQRAGTQVTVHADGLDDDDLATIVVDTLRAAQRGTTARASVFTCPPQGDGVISCHDDTQLRVTSVAELLRELAAVQAAPVIAGGDIIGIRLIGDPPRLLRRDDVILGVNSHRITEPRQLAELAGKLDGAAALAVRREGDLVSLTLSE